MTTGRTDARVTVVIPVFNGARYLTEAVRSVTDQTIPAHEIVVVDDGSTDATPEVARSLPVVYLRQDNTGPAGALNTGIRHATGDHLAFVSADDRWSPDKLEVQLDALGSPDAPDAVFGHVQHFLSPDLDPETAEGLRCPSEPKPASSAGTMLIATATFDRVGPFAEEFRVGEFFDWYARATDLGLDMAILPQVVSYRRVHERNHSRVEEAPTAGYMQVLRTIRRRRAASPDVPGDGP